MDLIILVLRKKILIINISNGNNGKRAIQKPSQICLKSKRPHTIIQINDNIHMDSTIAGS